MEHFGALEPPTVSADKRTKFCSLGESGVARDIRVPRRIRVNVPLSGRSGLWVSFEVIEGRYAITAVEVDTERGPGALAPSPGDQLPTLPRGLPKTLLECLLDPHLAMLEIPEIPEAELETTETGRRRCFLAAQLYCLAYLCGLPPTVTVAERFGISQGAAAQVVRRARQLGYLSQTKQGVPNA